MSFFGEILFHFVGMWVQINYSVISTLAIFVPYSIELTTLKLVVAFS